MLDSSPFRPREVKPLVAAKFQDPRITADGSPRASVALGRLQTLWFNTGTLCNITCATCYIESSPRNDRLAYLTAEEVRGYLRELDDLGFDTPEIGFTGGEPFMNREIISMLDAALRSGRRCLVLTNGMKPMRRWQAALDGLRDAHGDRLVMRVSLDHHTREAHEAERGIGAWAPAVQGLRWLAAQGFHIAVAGRRLPGEAESTAREGYRALFRELRINLDVRDPNALVLFPEMDATADVPEITEACWGLLGKSPQDVMCASNRMVVKRKGASQPVVVACTLTPYEPGFELGPRLADALARVPLNHPHCARFCVLGGASCSAT